MLTNYTNAPQWTGIIGARLAQWQARVKRCGTQQVNKRAKLPGIRARFAILHPLESPNPATAMIRL